MLKIRRPLGRLIFNMGIAIPGKTVFLIETAPRSLTQRTLVPLAWSGADLTHWSRRKMVAISQTLFANPLSSVKNVKCRLKFHWICFQGSYRQRVSIGSKYVVVKKMLFAISSGNLRVDLCWSQCVLTTYMILSTQLACPKHSSIAEFGV